MKAYILLSMVFLFFSCGEDFLNKYPNTQITEDNFYKTEVQIRSVVDDCYRQLNKLYEPSSIPDLYGELYSDNTWIKFIAGDNPYPEEISLYRQMDNSIPIRDAWNKAYNGIFICNNALYWLENAVVEYASESSKNNYMGEVLVIRALHYFNMVQAWGGVPMPLIPVSSEESYGYLREDPVNIYKQILMDLVKAKDYLPEKYAGKNIGKITKYAASGVLAKVYLVLGEKTKALGELKFIVESNNYSLDANNDGVVNPADYTYLFAYSTKNCNESLLECQTLAGVNNPNSTHQFAYSPFLWSFHLPGSASTFRGLGFNAPTFELRNEFEEVDSVRRDITVQEGFIDLDNGKWEDYPYTVKFADISNWQYSGNNFKIIRYADILLLYAETLGETEGVKYLNEVRKRAGLPSWGEKEYPKDKYPTFALAIEHERRVELAMEFHRFFDLVRTKRALTVINSKGFNLTEDRLLFPIPVEAIDVNPALTQNFGY